MGYKGFVGSGTVGNFLSRSELELKFPAEYHAGRLATVEQTIGEPSLHYSNGVAWNAQQAVTKGVAVAGNKTLSTSDLEQIQDVSAAATLTIPSDAILRIAATDRVTFGAYQQTAGAVAWTNGAGVSPLRGTAPTAAQYLVTGLVHVGANEWAYL